MATTFTYAVDRGYSQEVKPRVLTNEFGDGYAQRTPDGINTIESTWNVKFSNRSVTEADAIDAFFKSTYGADYFFWTPPGETEEVKVIVSSWNKMYESHISRTITATFTRVFEN